MKPKQIIVLSVILVVLALGIFLKTWVRSAADNAGLAEKSDSMITSFDPSKVDRILIAHGAEPTSVELKKEKGSWEVKSLWNAKADPVKVQTLIQKLHSVRGELRSTGKKFFPDFEIRDTDGFSIKFLDAGNMPLADLRLGKKRAGEEGYFLRKAAGESIYLVDLNMAELLGIHADFDEAAPLSSVWADLSLFNLDPEKVTKITAYQLKKGEGTMVLGLSRTTDPKDPAKSFWEFQRRDMTLPIDPEKVLKFIATLISIKAQKVVDPGGKNYGLEQPVWQLAVSEGDKKTILSAGPKTGKEGLYYVKTSARESVFVLNAGFFDDLNVDDTHFVKGASPAGEPKKDTAENIPADPSEQGPAA